VTGEENPPQKTSRPASFDFEAVGLELSRVRGESSPALRRRLPAGRQEQLTGMANLLVTLLKTGRFTSKDNKIMKHIMRHVENKQSYTFFGWNLPEAIFCFLAEARVEIVTPTT
jgi:hypothetical protein